MSKKNQTQNQTQSPDPENKDLLNLDEDTGNKAPDPGSDQDPPEDKNPEEQKPEDKTPEPPKEKIPKEKIPKTAKGKFDQVSYDRFIELKFIAIKIGGEKNLKKQYQEELEKLSEIVMSNPGIEAKDNKTIHVKGEVVKLAKGFPVSERVFNLFNEKQQAQYFEI